MKISTFAKSLFTITVSGSFIVFAAYCYGLTAPYSVSKPVVLKHLARKKHPEDWGKLEAEAKYYYSPDYLTEISK